jgi:hypothetical protein
MNESTVSKAYIVESEVSNALELGRKKISANSI